MNFSTFWDSASAISTLGVFIFLIIIGVIPATGKIMDGRVRDLNKRYTMKG
jgi:hypothetical protein